MVASLYRLQSVLALPEHLDLYELGIAERVDFSFSGPQAARLARMLGKGQIRIGAIHTCLELFSRYFVDLTPHVALVAAQSAYAQGNLYTGANIEDTPAIIEATAFKNGIVIAQVNELVDKVPCGTHCFIINRSCDTGRRRHSCRMGGAPRERDRETGAATGAHDRMGKPPGHAGRARLPRVSGTRAGSRAGTHGAGTLCRYRCQAGGRFSLADWRVFLAFQSCLSSLKLGKTVSHRDHTGEANGCRKL